MIDGKASSMFIIVLWNYFALIVNVAGFVIIYMKANKNATLRAFFVVQVSMIIWLVGKIFKTVSPTVELRWFFIVFYYFGICLLGVSFLDFAYTYYKRKPMNIKFRIAIYTIAILEFALVATNPYHHKFYKIFNFNEDDFGILFYVYLAVNYLFLITGTVLCSRKFSNQLKDKSRLERSLIAFAILLPLVFNLIYISRVLENFFIKLGIGNFIFDITPIVYTWSLLIFVYATFKYEFFELTPIMKHEIASRLDNPIVVLSSNAKVLYSNDQFNTHFDLPQMQYKIATLLKGHTQDDSVLEYNGRFYKCYMTSHKRFLDRRFIIVFTDISSHQYAKNELDKENRQLEIANKKLEEQIELLKQTSHVGARSYIARELHDILGHSLVITIKLLEVSKMFYKNNKKRAVDSLEKASLAIHDGFNEMKGIQTQDKNEVYTASSLERELRNMLKVVNISGIGVTFFLRGSNHRIEEKVFDIVRKVTIELVTNTLKHAQATKMLLSVTINENQITVQTMDNGVGAETLIKGNGLIGIDDRLSLVGGSAKYSHNHSEGFSANIIIPLNSIML